MFGHGGHRGMLWTLALSVVLYVVFLLLAMALIPLVLAGPEVVERLLPEPLDWLNRLYWPITVCGSALFLAILYSIAILIGAALNAALAEVRHPERNELPSAPSTG